MKLFTILVVDDEPINIKLLTAMLASEGYRIEEASNGKQAMNIVNKIKPDLILLDVMMPDVDGFEVCRKLKEDPATRMIPIVMVTALQEKAHRQQAMEAGADDFLSKPVDRIELLIRVKSLLRIKRYSDDLVQSYQSLREKNRQLRELERVKEGLMHMIIHDLRGPLTVISGNLELSLFSLDDSNEHVKMYLTNCRNYCDYLEQIIQSLLDIYKMEQHQMSLNKEKADPWRLALEVKEQFALQAGAKDILLKISHSVPLPEVDMDRLLIKRVISNLMDNAIRHTPESGVIQLTMEVNGKPEHLYVKVKDSGPGLPKEYHEKIFDKFEQVRIRKSGSAVGSSGLGLAFCKMAVELHGGKIWVESEGENSGSTFAFQIPVSPPPTISHAGEPALDTEGL